MKDTIRFSGWSLHKEGQTYVYSLDRSDNPDFGRPIKKSKSNKRRKSKANKRNKK